MNRFIAPSILLLVLVGAVISAGASQLQDDPAFQGKTVIIYLERSQWGPYENVKVDSIGKIDFLAVPINSDELKSPAYALLPLTDVKRIETFLSKDDAVAYENKRRPKKVDADSDKSASQ